MLQLEGNYTLLIKFGDVDLPLQPSQIIECSIIQDINQTVPSFRLRLMDVSGVFTHNTPFDKSMSRIQVEFHNPLSGVGSTNTYEFIVYSRKPVSLFRNSMIYDIVGVLDVTNLFAPSVSRTSNPEETIKQFLARVADELGVDRCNISNTLDIVKTVMQPNWTNSELLRDLRQRLYGNIFGEGNDFKIFITVKNAERIFNVLSWNEMIRQDSGFKFITNPDPVQDLRPILDFKIYDYYRVLNSYGCKKQDYNYYDYDTSAFTSSSVSYDNFESLTDYHMVDKNDSDDSDSIWCGRNNEFAGNFSGKITNVFYDRMSNLSKIWIDTLGEPSLIPGTTILIIFSDNETSGFMMDYQYSGKWLVERVIHMIGTTYYTRLLLTRNGVDTSLATSLIPANTQARLFSTARSFKVPVNLSTKADQFNPTVKMPVTNDGVVLS